MQGKEREEIEKIERGIQESCLFVGGVIFEKRRHVLFISLIVTYIEREREKRRSLRSSCIGEANVNWQLCITRFISVTFCCK